MGLRSVFHDFDPDTWFCTRCAHSMGEAMTDGSWVCPATDNVTGIAHLIARRRADQTFRDRQG